MAVVDSLLARSLLRHHMFDLHCGRRNGTANFGRSAATPVPGTAADGCGTSTQAWSAAHLVELPGIESAAKSSLNSEIPHLTTPYDVKRRQATCGYTNGVDGVNTPHPPTKRASGAVLKRRSCPCDLRGNDCRVTVLKS